MTSVGQAVVCDADETKSGHRGISAGPDLEHLLIDSIQDYAIFVLDPAGHVRSWNRGAQRLKGYAPDEIIGHHFSVFYPPADVALGKPERVLQEAARAGRYEDEGWRVRKNGERFWANVVITALRDPSGTLVGFAKITRDLTERHLAERRAATDAQRLAIEGAARAIAEERTRELQALLDQIRAQASELERRRAEAAAANQSKSDFLAAMSHELRTPLNAIGGYAELLAMELRGPLTPEQHADIDRIRASQRRLLGIINDLLNFTRVESGRVDYDLADVPVAEVLDAVNRLLAPELAAHRLTNEALDCGPDVRVRADREKMEQILLNLLSNASKYTPPGGHVAWACRVTADVVRITLADTGPGIPADRLGDIFDPFVQIGRSFATANEGAGLGLAISRDLARAMGGDLTVESTVGKGSAFSLDLPRAGGPDGGRHVTAGAAARGSRRSRRAAG